MSEQREWHAANQEYLMAALDQVRSALLALVGDEESPKTLPGMPSGPAAAPALETLAETFDLTAFERGVLLLCAGPELDASFADLCARAQGAAQRNYPTFSLALEALPNAHWSALTPMATLRHWRLIEVSSGSNLMNSPLRIDERVLHYLTGTPHLDEQLSGFVEPVQMEAALVPSHRRLAEQILAVWTSAPDGDRPPVVQLSSGNDRYGKQAVAAAVCEELGWALFRMPAQVIPTTPHELDILVRLWEREAVLSGAALLVDGHDVNEADAGRSYVISRLVEEIGSPIFLMGRERRRSDLRPMITFDVDMPTTDEQYELWRQALGEHEAPMNGAIGRLTAQFNLNAQAIRSAFLLAAGQLPKSSAKPAADEVDLEKLLWDACRTQARPQLDDLAQRIKAVANWDDLVLPEREKQTLRDIAVQVGQRTTVYEQWGFAEKSARGLGISALFSGPSGTGKTMAAEVLANDLALDLYRIDLSQVVSKYIGETEKNLARVFDAAEAGGAVLLFDEADALFGKRSEVKDSHDRYANIEIGYLLQRMESYRGLAILTTNMKNAMDNAFLRRIRFIVAFRFPDAAQRAAIWERIFPEDTPTDGLNLERLAQLNVAGGNIRNIAMNAAFYAAGEGEAVNMDHILRAARAEYNKLERTLTNTETRSWS